MLQETVEKAYDLFAKYSAHPPLDVCTQECCMSVEDMERLAALPVKEIPMELLREYNDNARSLTPKIEEAKHFLPRYLELISKFEFPTHSSELSLHILEPFTPGDWMKEESDLLNKFAVEFFNTCLNVYPLPSFGEKIDSILIMFWKGGINISSLLSNWTKTESVESILHLSDFYSYGMDEYHKGKMNNPFADAEINEIVMQWFENAKNKKAFQEKIEKLMIDPNELDDKTSSDLSMMYEILRTN